MNFWNNLRSHDDALYKKIKYRYWNITPFLRWPIFLNMSPTDYSYVHWFSLEFIVNWAWAFLAAPKQLYEWYFLSVCLSVCLSVTPFWLCFHHCIIMKLSGVITKNQGNVHAKNQGQSSNVKVTEVTTQLSRFWTVTPDWIQIWWWNDTYSLMLLRRGALLFFKVIRQISRSHGAKNRRIWPRLGVSGL